MKHLIPTAIFLSLLSPLSRAEDLDYATLYTQSITIKASEIPGFVEVYAGHQLLDARAVRTLSRISPRTTVLENPGVAGGPKAESWVELVFDLGGPATEILRTSQPFEAVKAIVRTAAHRSGRDTAQIAKPTAAVILDAGRPHNERSTPLPEAEVAWVQGVLAGVPRLEKPAVPLEPVNTLVVNGTRYALEPDELIQFAGEGSRHWSSPGIKKRLLDSADRHRADKEPPPKESIQELTRRLAPGGITKDEAAQIANAACRAVWGEPGGELKVTKCELNQAKTWEIEVWWDLGLPNGGARMWIHQTGGFERADYIPGE